MSWLGLQPVLPWPVAVLLGVLLLGLAVLGLVTRPDHRRQWGLRTATAGAAALALLGLAGAALGWRAAPAATGAPNVRMHPRISPTMN